jgi:hypothetical protein
LIKIFGFTPGREVQKMAERVEEISPARPLRIVAIAEDHHANAGAGIHDGSVSMAFRPGAAIDDRLVSHELGHLLIGLQYPHLIIGDSIPRRSPDRRMVGRLLSVFEHPSVYALQQAYGIDLAPSRAEAFVEYRKGIEGITAEPEFPRFLLDLVTGYVEMQYLLDDVQKRSVDQLIAARAPKTLEMGRRLAGIISPDRVTKHAYRAMLDDVVKIFEITGEWPQHVHLMPAARSDGRAA